MSLRVKIDWSERVTYTSVIDLSDTEVAAMRQLNLDPSVGGDVQEYLESVHDEVWFERCDTANDFENVMERELTNVEPLQGEAGEEG